MKKRKEKRGKKQNRAPTKPKGRSLGMGRKYGTRIYAGVLADGSELATVEQVLDPATPTRTGKDLSGEEAERLCLGRIQANTNFVKMRMLGSDTVIDKKRAIQEIKKRSALGLHLLEIERHFVRLQVERHHRGTKGKVG